MTRHAISLLHDVLFVGQQQRTGQGRPKLMDPNAELGLFLFFIGSTMGYKHLCLIFDFTPTVCSRVMNKMLKLVVKKLKRHPLARVKFPNAEQMEYYAQLIHEQEPAVDDVIGFMDYYNVVLLIIHLVPPDTRMKICHFYTILYELASQKLRHVYTHINI